MTDSAEFIGVMGLIFKSEQKLRRHRQKTPCMGGSRTNENDCRQKPAFAAWPSQTDARRQYSPLVLMTLFLRVVCFYSFFVELFHPNRVTLAYWQSVYHCYLTGFQQGVIWHRPALSTLLSSIAR